MNIIYFASESAEASGLGALGVSFSAFLIQLLTFILVFMILKKFVFDRVGKLLEQRRKVIDDGVRMGLRMEKEKAKLDDDVKKALREARQEADRIIANANKEAREILRESEKTAQRKTEAMIADVEARIEEDKKQALKKLEKDIVGLVSEATETIVHEKVDPKKDAELIDKAIRGKK
ncbi:F0F1 ATP synthase subunit B [Candidatus Saccharibacteria bacterium]|nr:F0F1 ATP synthase subunit B [Candidatus Saccharibacteria bacterium]